VAYGGVKRHLKPSKPHQLKMYQIWFKGSRMEMELSTKDSPKIHVTSS